MNIGLSRKITSALILATLCTVARANSTSDAWPMSQSQWNAGNGVEGAYGNWYFKQAWYDQWNNSHWWGDYHDANWNASNSCWNSSAGDNRFDYITRTQVNVFDLTTSLIIAWQCPETGTYNLNVSVDYYAANWGQSLKSIGLSIQERQGNTFSMLDDLTYYQTAFTSQTATLYAGSITLNTGDWLYFRTQVKADENRVQPLVANWNIAIPEPASLALLFLGAGSLAFRRRR